ncbi:MAG: hypothetical protein HND44_11330 [Chloroflexi bacterium]|nr:hypothetical protein [Ardenticatenaceae bacterium]NOG35149.1 hypothetical protein [Chloroflexota bacterium]
MGQISIINVSLRNIGDSACWDVLFELNLPPDGIIILEGRKTITAEHFPSNSTLEHQIRILAKKPGNYVLTSRRFHFGDSEDISKNLNWQITLVATGDEYTENELGTTQTTGHPTEKFWTQQRSERHTTGEQFTKIYENILQAFNMDELRLICLEMSIDFEVLSGDNKSRKILDLLVNCQRRGTLNELLAICQRQRPHLSW